MRLLAYSSAKHLLTVGFILTILPSVSSCGKTALITSAEQQSTTGASATTTESAANEAIMVPAGAPPGVAPNLDANRVSLSYDTNQTINTVFDANQIRYASMQNETWSFYSGGNNGQGAQQTLTGSVLVLSSDPNSCIVSKSGTVTKNTFTVKILSADFVAALTQTGSWPNRESNTWGYI